MAVVVESTRLGEDVANVQQRRATLSATRRRLVAGAWVWSRRITRLVDSRVVGMLLCDRENDWRDGGEGQQVLLRPVLCQ